MDNKCHLYKSAETAGMWVKEEDEKQIRNAHGQEKDFEQKTVPQYEYEEMVVIGKACWWEYLDDIKSKKNK